MTSDALPAVPSGLSDRAGALWSAVLDEYELGPAELELLRVALVALDRADAAAELLRADGLTVTDRYGSAKCHPAVDVEHKARGFFAAAVRQLGVKVDESSPLPDAPRRARPGPKPAAARARLRAVEVE